MRAMSGQASRRHANMARRGIALLATAVVAAGCAAANKTASSSSSTASTSASASSSGGSGSMAGMNMGSSTTAVPSVNGIKPVPTQPLASAIWQGMRISAEATTAVPFVIYDGTSEQLVKPGPNTSFHLMVMLSDAQTGVAIPYAGVWATISKAGKVVYDERQWPMLSRYMGPHYGNDVTLPGAGSYQLTLLVSPPVSARHVEYQNVWLHPHRVTVTFNWKPVA
jgi:predicted metal-binding membrane protein